VLKQLSCGFTFEKYVFRILDKLPVFLTDDFLDTPRSLQKNVWIARFYRSQPHLSKTQCCPLSINENPSIPFETVQGL
jgi:hypothetical protein